MRQIQHCLHTAAGYTNFEQYADGIVSLCLVSEGDKLCD